MTSSIDLVRLWFDRKAARPRPEDDPMTPDQALRLKALSAQADETFEPRLTREQAQALIQELEGQLSRG